MIAGSVHAVSPDLTQSLQEFRSQLESRRATRDAEPRSLDTQRTQGASQERRDTARKSAVQAVELRHTQRLVDTYIAASSNDGDEEDTHTKTVDPARVYHTSVKYTRRMDLVDAFEQAGERVNLVV